MVPQGPAGLASRACEADSAGRSRQRSKLTPLRYQTTVNPACVQGAVTRFCALHTQHILSSRSHHVSVGSGQTEAWQVARRMLW